jgi:cytochrome P450
MQRDSLSFFIQMARDYDDIVQTRMLSQPCYLLFHPDYVKHVLQEHNTNYDRNHTIFHVMKQFTGNGLATTDGPSWLQQRRLIQPAFHRQRIAPLGTIMTTATESMCQRWSILAGQGAPLDIPEEMFNLTLRIVGQALFSTDLSDEANTTSRAFRALLSMLTRYLFLPFPPLGVPTPYNLRLRAALQRINTIISGIIIERRRQEPDKQDLLSMLLAARDEETGEGMNDVQLRDEVMTMLLAGHETTANTLNWTWYLLALHPEVEERLHTEVEGVLGGPSSDALYAHGH